MLSMFAGKNSFSACSGHMTAIWIRLVLRGQCFPPDRMKYGTLPNTTACLVNRVTGVSPCSYYYHLSWRRGRFKELIYKWALTDDRLASAFAAMRTKPPNLCHILTFPEETEVSVHQKLRERKSLFTLSEWSCQDILRVLGDHDGWLYFQCSQRRKIYLAVANIFFGGWEAGLSRVTSGVSWSVRAAPSMWCWPPGLQVFPQRNVLLTAKSLGSCLLRRKRCSLLCLEWLVNLSLTHTWDEPKPIMSRRSCFLQGSDSTVDCLNCALPPWRQQPCLTVTVLKIKHLLEHHYWKTARLSPSSSPH